VLDINYLTLIAELLSICKPNTVYNLNHLLSHSYDSYKSQDPKQFEIFLFVIKILN
jgi:hypothetical protein